jgi:hypothetical protein
MTATALGGVVERPNALARSSEIIGGADTE